MFALVAQHMLAIRLILAKAHGYCHLLCHIVGVVGQPMLVEEVRIAVFQAWDRCGVDEWDMLDNGFGGSDTAWFGKDQIGGVHQERYLVSKAQHPKLLIISEHLLQRVVHFLIATTNAYYSILGTDGSKQLLY